MEELEKLYNVLKRDGYYTKSFEDFKVQSEDLDYQEKLYNVVKRDGLFTKSKEDFDSKYFLKKKEQTIQPSVQGGSTDLSSEDGSLVSAESLKKQQKDREDREAMLAKINAPMSEEEYTTRLGETIEEDTKRKQLEQWEKEREVRELKEKEFERKFIRDPETGVYRKRTLQEAAEVARDYRTDEYQDEAAKALELIPGGKRDIDMSVDGYQTQQIQDYLKTQENIEEELPALQAKQNAEAAAKSQMKDIEEQVRLGNIEDEGFQFALSTIKPELIDKEEDVVVDKLRKQFDGYGFVFQETGIGDAMLVAAPNGATITIDLDPFFSQTEIAESKKLRDFMLVNSTHKPAAAPTGLVINSMRAKQLRDVARDNGDGSESTVLFTSYEQDGKYKVIPTLFPKDPETYTAKPADWMEPTFERSMEIAEKRGEVFVFDTEEEAEDFAQGNWKDVSTHEAEALDFYRKRGMDYESEKQVYDKYMDATDIMFFLDPDRDGSANLFGENKAPFNQESLTEEQVEMLGNNVDKLYIDGKLRQDAQQLLKDAEKVADRLSPAFLAEESQLAREEFDLYLNKRHQAEIPKAIEMNFRVKEIEDKIVEDALENFNLRPEELVGIDFEDPIKNEKARKISQAFEETQVYKSIAADKYYNANTYYDMKHNKAAAKEYADNWDSFTTEWSGGLSRGRAGDVILAGAFYPEILGNFDLNDPESTQKMAEKLVMHLQEEPDKISRVMSRYSQARTSSEIANVIFSDPLEWATSLAAGSLSQMLPYGWKIVAGTTATGAATGAAIGAPAAGVGAVPGAITGGVWGFRTGMAATSLAMEYTNEMIESIREFCEENGSTVNDAEMVALALQNQSVWDKGRERGLKRGIPIAMVDMFTKGLAGKLLVPSKLAGKGSRIAGMAAERLALDPLFEGVGEYAAQINVGDDIDWKEIYAEAGGAVGNNTSSMSINLLLNSRKTSNIEKASELTRINDIINESASDSRISEWGNNMERLGQISPEENKRIQDNVGLRKTANELLSTGRVERRLQGKGAKALTERVMQLLAAKEELSSTTNRKELFGKKIGEINDELNDIITTKKLKPKDKQTMLEGTGVLFSGEQASTADIRGAMPTYKLKTNKFKRARQVTKQEMLNYIESSTPEKLNNTLLIKVSNDSDVNNALVKKMMQGKLEDKLAETQAEVADAESISVVEGEVDVDATETVAEEVVSSKTLEEVEGEQEAKKAEIAKREKQLKSTQEKRDREYQEENWTEEEKEWNLKAGDKVVEGKIIDMDQQDDLRTDKSKDGVRIVTSVVKKGTSKTRQKVDVALFDSQEAADQWLKEKSEKFKNRHQKNLDKIDAKYETKSVAEEVVSSKTLEEVEGELVAKKAEIAKREKQLKFIQKNLDKIDAKYDTKSVENTEDVAPSEPKVYSDISENIEVFGEFTTNVSSLSDLENLPTEVQKVIDLGKKLDSENVTWEINRDLGVVDGRQIIEMKASNGDKFLMYNSTGEGTGAASKGQWVPMLGFSQDGGFIKGAFNPETGKTFTPRGSLSNENNPKFNKYGSKTFKKIAEELESGTQQVTEDVVEEVTPTTEEVVDAVLFEQEAEDLKAFLDNQSDPQFQLSSEETSPKRKQKLEEAATELMNEVQPEIVEESFTVEEPAVEPIPVNITENKELSDKVPKIKLKDLVKSKINLVMADQLKVDKDLMGGHFFPLMEDTFGKVAWASIDLQSARAIVRGSIKSDKSVVFNMNPTAVDSNLAVIDAFVSDIQKAPNPDKIFTEMMSYLQTVKHGKKTEEVHNMARDSKNLAEFVDAFSELDVDTKSAITTKVIPTKDINPKLNIGKILKEQGITQEKIRDEISEQFAKDLPMGAMTMVLEITDADGNPITKEADIDKAIMTQEQQDAEGIRRHRNYPVYIRGRAVAMLEDTVPFWKVSKEATNTIDKKLARVIQPKEKYTVDMNGSKRIVKVSTSKGARTIKLMKKGTTDKVESESTLPKSNKKPTAKIIESKYGKITKTEGVGKTYTESDSERAEYRRAQMQASKSFEVQEARENTYRRFINRLTKAFPSVEVLASKEEFNNLVENLAAKKLSTKAGDVAKQKIYGAVLDGKLYLNPSLSNFNTPVHEFGHIWMNVAKEMNPEAYKSGLNLIKDSEYVSQVENNAAYQKVIKQMKKDGATEEDIRNYILEEALATAIGDKGESFVNAAQKRNFKNWLNELFEFVKKLTGISKMTPEQIQNLSLDEFLNSVVVDLMSENKLFKDAEVRNLSNELQLMTASPNPSIDNIVSTARANGFSDASIRVVLKDRGFKAADIKEAMTVQIDLVTEMPSEFGNVEGGAIVGQKLFNEVRDAVNAFAIEGPRGGVGTAGVRTKTFAEVRGKAIEIMKDNKVFEAQNDETQKELLNAFDRALGIRSNPRVRQQIADIRAKLRAGKVVKKNLTDAQRAMRMRIRQLLPNSEYTSTQLNKLLRVVNETTAKNFDGQMTRVLDEVEKQRTKIRNQVILDIQKLVTNKAKTKKTSDGKRRSAGLDAIGQSYFAEVKKVLRAAIKQDTDAMIALQESVDEFVFSEGMEIKQEDGKLTTKQQQMIDRQIALDTFSNVLTMSLEDVVTLFNEVKETRGESIARLKSNREVRRMMTERIKDDFNNQLKKDFKELYNDDGVALERPQLKKRRESIRSAFRNNGVWTGLSKWSKQFLPEGRKYKVNDLTKFFYNNIAHLGTITNILDRGKKGMFTKVFYDNLNNMDENNLKGVRRVTDKMNAITQSVVGKNWMDWKYSLGSDTETLTGFKSTLENLSDEPEFNKDQAMRVIALAMNDTQREKMELQGLTNAKLKQLKTFVGEDQVKIIEQVVDFLSTTYFEETNAVYSRVNDVNLGFVENYFPTQTLSQAEITADAVTGTEIQKIFNAEFSPALKERTDRTSDVVLDLSFTDVMEEHTKQMEKYKAYAVGVKEINSVLKDRGIQNILNETGVKKVFDIALNYAINPDAGPSVDPTIIDKLQRKYTGFALAFKLIQIPKQATSFVQAYDSYAGGKTKVPGYKLLNFMFDYAKVLVMLRSEIKEAREISATFDNRIKQGLEGDVFGLESGTRTFKKGTAQQGKRGKLKRGFRKASGLPTVAGDILGVLGYKAVYNKAIRDGKSKAEALRMFNDYNATQQSRRATEKNQLQQSNDWKARFFTMFGSTVFLQQNKVYQSLNNLLKLKKPSSKDVKTFALNYAVANVLFTMAAYSASLISGNSDDRDRAYKAMLDAAKGKNLLFQIPMLGAALEGMNNKITGDRKPISEGVNPFMILPSKVMKAYDGLNPQSIVKTATPFLEIMLGAQLDAPVALAKLMGGDASEENVLTTLGVSKSYRPGYGQKESKTTKKKEQTEAQMKKALKLNNEETYNKRYGPGTQSYKREQKMKERKKEMRERTRARRR